jgi:hypothetical protein
VALLQSQGTGRAKITAIVRGTDLQASIDVQVIERDNFAEPNIIVPKTIYMLNPREKPFQIEAYLQGVGVTEENHYGIQWEAMLLSGGEIEETIGMYPGELAENNNIKILRGTGPVIQLEILNPPLPDGQNFETKEIVIMVSQPEITTRTKAVYIKIAEVSGMFTLNKLDISMEAQGMADLSCNILGGTTSDYKEVAWFAETDSVGREIVKIMGTGKDVQLLGVHDGTVYVTAMYRNEIAECRVQVKSSFYLKLQYEIFLTYPGARSEGNQLIEIEYEVRPFTTQIMWTPQGPTPDADDPVARVLASTQNYENGKGKITIDPVKEGSFTLIGITNRTTARMTVLIQNVYSMRISNNRFFMRLAETTTYDPAIQQSDPYWNYDSIYKYIKVSDGGEDKIGDSIYMPFTFCPPDYRIGFDPDSVALMEKYGIRHEISPLLRINDLEGKGIIKLTATREIPRSEYGDDNKGIILALDLKKPFEETTIDPSLYSSNPNSLNNRIYIKCQLPLHKTAAIPVFQRVFGNYSNPNNMYKYRYCSGSSDTGWNNVTELTNIGPGANGGFDVNNPHWYMNYPTGVLPQFNNQEYWTSTSEYMRLYGNYQIRTEGHYAGYELELGDGERHYILLDKTHEGMYYEFDGSSLETFNKAYAEIPFYKDNKTRAPSAKLVNLNGETAIEISGGADFMVYDRIYVKKRKTHTFEYYFKSSGTQYGRDVSESANIYNYKGEPAQFNAPIKGYSAKDYFIVKKYGVPLSSGFPDDGGIDYDDDTEGNDDDPFVELEIDDDTVLKSSVQYQIVYWREKNPDGADGRPIRIRYDYSLTLGGVVTWVDVVANDGNPGGFISAKDYFKEGPLYVTKIDRGSEFYLEGINGGQEPYFNNVTISQIGMEVRNTHNLLMSHDEMVEKNPHFNAKYDGVLYIVSDFDLGLKNKIWYIASPDMWEKMGVGYTSNDPNSANFRGKLRFASAGNYMKSATSNRNYFRIFYNIENRETNANVGERDLLYWDDEAFADQNGYFTNYYDGRYYRGNLFVRSGGNEQILMLMPGTNHILNGKDDKICFLDLTQRGSYTKPRWGWSAPDMGTVTEARQVNYKAIISMLKHNKNTIFSAATLDGIDNAAAFKTLYNGLSQQNKDTIKDLILESNEKGMIQGSRNQSRTNYEDFNTRTLYVKFDTEENHNKAYPLKDFTDVNPVNVTAVNNFPFKSSSSGSNVWMMTIVNENICDSEYYEPAASTNETVAYSHPGVDLTLRYKNSYSDENAITIKIIHKVRGNEATKNELVRTEWDKVEAVKSLIELNTENTSFTHVSYSTYLKNYFFVPKRGDDDIKY